MSSILKIELNSDGVRELLKSEEMGAICHELAESIASECEGEASEVFTGQNRVNVSVSCTDKGDNALLIAMGGRD